MASVHRELAEKQSLAFSMTFLPTKLELTTASAETSFVFEFSSPDIRSNFQQAFEDAKKKLGMRKHMFMLFNMVLKGLFTRAFPLRVNSRLITSISRFLCPMCVAMNKDQWDPEFLKAIPIMKTRSGMQVSETQPVLMVCRVGLN